MKGATITTIGLTGIVIKFGLMGFGLYHLYQFDPHVAWGLALFTLGTSLKFEFKE